jgi:hypothetical protein
MRPASVLFQFHTSDVWISIWLDQVGAALLRDALTRAVEAETDHHEQVVVRGLRAVLDVVPSELPYRRPY